MKTLVRPSTRKVKLHKHDTSKTLGDFDLVLKTFSERLADGDEEGAREVLAASLHHVNKVKLAEDHGIPRRTTYNLLDKNGNPTLSLVAKIFKALKKESAAKTP